VGTLSREPSGSTFAYTQEFLLSSARPITRNLPKDGRGVTAGGVLNIPPFFAGLLPEGIMAEVVSRRLRLQRDDLFSLLAATAWDAVGDVTVHEEGVELADEAENVKNVPAQIRALIEGTSTRPTSALAGAQPKMSVGESMGVMRGQSVIVKIEPDAYPGLVENEHYFMRLAKASGIHAAEVAQADSALIVKRFDRVRAEKGQLPDQRHVEDVLQLLNMYPASKYALDYLEIMDLAVELGVAKAVLLEVLQLYAFSHLIGNGDLHAKNVSFMIDPLLQQWRLTPAYDLLSTLPYDADHPYHGRMALPLDEQWDDFEPDDFIRIGAKYGLPDAAVKRMLQELVQRVHKGIGNRAKPSSIPQPCWDEIDTRLARLA